MCQIQSIQDTNNTWRRTTKGYKGSLEPEVERLLRRNQNCIQFCLQWLEWVQPLLRFLLRQLSACGVQQQPTAGVSQQGGAYFSPIIPSSSNSPPYPSTSQTCKWLLHEHPLTSQLFLPREWHLPCTNHVHEGNHLLMESHMVQFSTRSEMTNFWPHVPEEFTVFQAGYQDFSFL